MYSKICSKVCLVASEYKVAGKIFLCVFINKMQFLNFANTLCLPYHRCFFILTFPSVKITHDNTAKVSVFRDEIYKIISSIVL